MGYIVQGRNNLLLVDNPASDTPMQNKQLFYFKEEDKYFHAHTGEWFTELELEALDNMEKAWRNSLPAPTFFELLDMFGPECYGAVKRRLSSEKKYFKQAFIDEHARRDRYYKEIITPIVGDPEQYIATEEMLEHGHKEAIAFIQKETKRVRFQLYFVRDLQKKEAARKKGLALPVETKSDRITEADVMVAKQVPIETVFPGKLRKMGSRAMAQCPFHSDRSPSFVVYLNTNTWHCFAGCEGRDTIDFVSKIQNVSFLEAVKQLCHK